MNKKTALKKNRKEDDVFTKLKRDAVAPMKTGRFTIKPGAPIELEEAAELESSVSEGERSRLDRVGTAIKAYLTACDELLTGRFSNLRHIVPIHMTKACQPIIFVFPDGVLVRYERKDNPELKVLIGIVQDEGTLSEWAPKLSEFFIHCPVELEGYDPGDQTLSVKLLASPSEGGEQKNLGLIRLFAVAPLSKLRVEATQGKLSRPYPAVSICNEFTLVLEGEQIPESGGRRREFLTRSRIRLPVGWEAIELYPPYESDTWNPELAPQWAEADLLAACVRRNLQDEQFRVIDPNTRARRAMAELINECRSLLSGPEETVHQFIKAHPQLLSPTHDKVWSKLPLGNRVTDFVIREPTGEYIFVELENPSTLLFRDDGQQREELTHAIDQVTDWIRYLQDNLSTVQREIGLEGISPNPKCLIVIGRSSSLTEENKRKLVTFESIYPRLKIITFDDLIVNAKVAVENLLGPIWETGPETEVYFRS